MTHPLPTWLLTDAPAPMLAAATAPTGEQEVEAPMVPASDAVMLDTSFL